MIKFRKSDYRLERVPQMALFWSAILILPVALASAAFMVFSPYALMLIFPEGKYMPFLYRGFPLIVFGFWGLGVWGAHRWHHSWPTSGLLTLVGIMLTIFSPFGFYLVFVFL
ncbi:hypothetical protein [Rubinisphaera margarita]|uniref:hypothetical protein n=1 Tax=Rubinisphaera margarita TaxID=2909586 RepID=UPI001EE9509A|nr:hypothetical protein [Rubinisphaera margarita]MCG6155041.1 hypothetical protein [Rubinisphaera margarita]